MRLSSFQTKKITYTGIMMALVYLGTTIIKIPISFTGGYIHIGDAFVFLSGILLGPVYGAFAAGIGSALADILGGYPSWALPTLIIKALMAIITGLFMRYKNNSKLFVVSTTFFISIWIGFIAIMKYFLQNATNRQLLEMEDLTTMDELIEVIKTINTPLLIIAIIVPTLMVITLVVIKFWKKNNFALEYNLSFIISGSLMVILYYFTYYILYGHYFAPIFAIPANMVQFGFGLVIANMLLPIVLNLSFNKHNS